MDNDFPPPPDFLMNPTSDRNTSENNWSTVGNTSFQSIQNNGNPGRETSAAKLPDPENETLTSENNWSTVGSTSLLSFQNRGNPSRETSAANLTCPENETFMPSTELAQMDDPSQWDCLLKTSSAPNDSSSLRKQSLYLKFDPLVENEAPKPDHTFTRPAPPPPVHYSSRDRKQDSDLLVKITPPSKPMAEPQDIRAAGDVETETGAPAQKEAEFAKPLPAKGPVVEEFHDSAVLGNAPPAEWDMLLGHGTSANTTTKWERESLYTKFDPLLKRCTAIGPTPVPRLESLSEPTLEVTQTITPITSPHADISLAESIKVVSPVAQTAGEKVDLWSLKQELLKKKQQLVQQAEESRKQFQQKMQQKSDTLKEITESIETVKKDIKEQEQQLASSERPVKAIQSELQKVEREITGARAESQKIADSKVETNEDLRQAELAFSDLHSKYEQVKTVLQNFKTNEDTLLSRQQALKAKIENREIKLRNLQEAAEEKMTNIKRDYGASLKNDETDLNKLRAQYRKVELHVTTLEKDVEQKQIENKKLSALCDDLIKGNRA